MEMSQIKPRVMKSEEQSVESEFQAIFDQTKDHVFTICMRMLRGRQEDAEDAFQLTYLRLLKEGLGSQNKEYYLIVGQLAVREADALRHRLSRRMKREKTMDKVEDRENYHGETSSEMLADKERREILLSLIQDLSEDHSRPLLLHYFDGYTHDEISTLLEIPRSTISYRLKKGLELLAPKVRKLGIDDLSKALGVVAAGAMLLKAPAHLSAQTILQASAGGVAVGATAPWYASLSISKVAVTLLAVVVLTTTIIVLTKSSPSAFTGAQRSVASVVDVPEEASKNIQQEGTEKGKTITDEKSGVSTTEKTMPLPASIPPGPGEIIIQGNIVSEGGESVRDVEIVLSHVVPIDRVGVGMEMNTVQDIEFKEVARISSPDGSFTIRAEDFPVLSLGAVKDGYAAPFELLINPTSIQMGAHQFVTAGRSLYRQIVVAESTSYSGKVTDRKNRPVQNARVYYRSNYPRIPLEPWKEIIANDSGEFEFKGLITDSVQVCVDQDGYLRRMQTVDLSADRMNILTLDSADQGYHVEGQLVDAIEGFPVSNVLLHLVRVDQPEFILDPIPYSATTSGTGSFRFEELSKGTYLAYTPEDTYRVLRDGENMYCAKFEVDSDIVDVVVKATSGITARGIVRDKETGEAVENAQVVVPFSDLLEGKVKEDYTDKEGRYYIKGVFPQITKQGNNAKIFKLDLEVNHPDYAIWKFDGGGIVDLFQPEIIKDIELKMGVPVTGKVLNPDGTPAQDAWVSLANSRSVGKTSKADSTDSNGNFTVYASQPGEHQVVIMKTGQPVFYSEPLEIHENGSTELLYTLEPSDPMKLYVKDALTGQPIANASVNLMSIFTGEGISSSNSNFIGNTGINGRLNVDDQRFFWTRGPAHAQEIQQRIVVSHPGYEFLIFNEFKKYEDGQIHLEGKMVPEGSGEKVEIILKDEEQQPLAGTKVTLSNPFGYLQSGYTDGDGSVFFEGVYQDAYQLQIEDNSKMLTRPLEISPSNLKQEIVLTGE